LAEASPDWPAAVSATTELNLAGQVFVGDLEDLSGDLTAKLGLPIEVIDAFPENSRGTVGRTCLPSVASGVARYTQEARMGVWSPAFEHKFLDGNLFNFTAAAKAGEPDISFEGPLVRPTPPAAERGFPSRGGNRFRYAFEPGLFGNIIGVDIRMEVAFPPGTTGQTSGEVVLGANTVRFLLGFVNGGARLQLVVNDAIHAGVANFDPAQPLRLQARWHTHGQGQLWVNAALVSYTPRLAPGQSLSLETLAFGHDSATPLPGTPAFLIRRLGVKLLRKDDAQRALNRLFPVDDVQVDPVCRRRLAAAQDAVFSEIRGFMRHAVGKLTEAWSTGQPGGPFTPQGLAAHAAAVAAGRAFVEFMLGRPERGGDPAAVDARLGEFLAAVRATDAGAYDEAIARLAATSTPLDAECLTQLQPLVDRHGPALAPLRGLLERLWARMQAPQVTP
jgi:hypothetical protein